MQQKRALPNPTFFDLSENWHSESFSQKHNTLIFDFSQKATHKKLQGYQPCPFHKNDFLLLRFF
jgi:hypothetical protein